MGRRELSDWEGGQPAIGRSKTSPAVWKLPKLWKLWKCATQTEPCRARGGATVHSSWLGEIGSPAC